MILQAVKRIGNLRFDIYRICINLETQFYEKWVAELHILEYNQRQQVIKYNCIYSWGVRQSLCFEPTFTLNGIHISRSVCQASVRSGRQKLLLRLPTQLCQESKMGKRHSGVLKNKTERMSVMSDIRFLYSKGKGKSRRRMHVLQLYSVFGRNVICNTLLLKKL